LERNQAETDTNMQVFNKIQEQSSPPHVFGLAIISSKFIQADE